MWGMINAVATSVAFVWGAPWRQGEALRVFRTIQRAAPGIGLGIVLLFYAYPDALLSRFAIYEETLMPNSPTRELTHRGWDYPVQNFLVAFDYGRWPYGYGIGTTSLGGQYVARFFNVKPPVLGVESGYGARYEPGDYSLRLEGRQKAEGVSLFSARLRHFLVRFVLAFPCHLCRHAGLPRFPVECVFLALARSVVPTSHHCALGTICG
jgi:hypothetical protein